MWPHDNCLVSAGLYRYGMRDEANRIALALLEAAAFTEYRLPEVFAGMLGLEPDGAKLTVNPDVPKQCGRLVFKGVHAFGQRFDVTGEGKMGGLGPAGSAG